MRYGGPRVLDEHRSRRRLLWMFQWETTSSCDGEAPSFGGVELLGESDVVVRLVTAK
jgi:hypothetical protein